MNDPWTWTTVWELMVGTGGGMSGGGQRGKNWDNCNNRITIKMIKNKNVLKPTAVKNKQSLPPHYISCVICVINFQFDSI